MKQFTKDRAESDKAFIQALADSVVRLIDQGKKGGDGTAFRMKDLAVSLSISPSSASQRVRGKDPVPFTAMELLRLSVYFQKPIHEIIDPIYWMTDTERNDQELCRKIGVLPTGKRCSENRASTAKSKEEVDFIKLYHGLDDEKKKAFMVLIKK